MAFWEILEFYEMINCNITICATNLLNTFRSMQNLNTDTKKKKKWCEKMLKRLREEKLHKNRIKHKNYYY